MILEQKLKLKMHPEKTKVVHFDEGFRFLGFDFWREYMVLPEDRVRKYQDRIRHLSRRQQGKKSLEEMIRKLNEVIRGFSNYFRIGNVKNKFQRLDEWIRMRVRAYISKRRSMESNWRIPNKVLDRKSTRLNSSHVSISYAVFCLKKKKLYVQE